MKSETTDLHDKKYSFIFQSTHSMKSETETTSANHEFLWYFNPLTQLRVRLALSDLNALTIEISIHSLNEE